MALRKSPKKNAPEPTHSRDTAKFTNQLPQMVQELSSHDVSHQPQTYATTLSCASHPSCASLQSRQKRERERERERETDASSNTPYRGLRACVSVCLATPIS